MAQLDPLLVEYGRQLKKAITHLKYSYDKIQNLTTDPALLNEETLETWESFSSRFSRVVDLFLTKYVRTSVLRSDPAFQGSLRDFADQAEKLKLVDSADAWMEMRALRNLAAHEYSESDLEAYFLDLKHYAPALIALETKIPSDAAS